MSISVDSTPAKQGLFFRAEIEEFLPHLVVGHVERMYDITDEIRRHFGEDLEGREFEVEITVREVR